MKNVKWQIGLGTGLLGAAAVLYLIHFLIFRSLYQIESYFLIDLAFLPIEVLIVTVIVHSLLTWHEKYVILQKMNMVIGVFFNEMGRDLLRIFSCFDAESERLTEALLIAEGWTEKDFKLCVQKVKSHSSRIRSEHGDLEELKTFLLSKREFMLRLLENPNLLEHDSFTSLLWAIFHLTDELAHRKQLKHLSRADHEHLAGDIRRAYVVMLEEWLAYLKHLRSDYPYLFSIAIRTNPFNKNAQIEFS